MKVLVIDIETTGFLKEGGRIVEIGVVELCLETGDKKVLLNSIINPELSEAELEKTWIVENKYMTVEEILNGVNFLYDVKDELQLILNNYPGATAFNKSFDFDFLRIYGIRFHTELKCPMIVSTDICKIPKTGKAAYYPGWKWPKVEEAYKHFYPDSNYVEIHRGADDAFHEADIVFALHKLNKLL